MKHYLMALGLGIWSAIKHNYTTLATPTIGIARKNLSDNNSNAIGAILNGLTDSVFVKIMHCCSAKDMWDKLQKIYEGDDKIKKEKLQTHIG